MKAKPLSQSNRYLMNKAKAHRLMIRNVASSTAIETGKPIEKIEAKISQQHVRATRVKLA